MNREKIKSWAKDNKKKLLLGGGAVLACVAAYKFGYRKCNKKHGLAINLGNDEATKDMLNMLNSSDSRHLAVHNNMWSLSDLGKYGEKLNGLCGMESDDEVIGALICTKKRN